MKRWGQAVIAISLLSVAFAARAQGTVTLSREEQTRDVIITNSSMQVRLMAVSLVWRCDSPTRMSMTYDYMAWNADGSRPIVGLYLPVDAGRSFTAMYSHNQIRESCPVTADFALFSDGSFTGTMDDLKGLKESRRATIRQILWLKDLLYQEDSPDESPGRLQKKLDDWHEIEKKTGQVPEWASFFSGYLSPQVVLEYVVGTMGPERDQPYMQRRASMLAKMSWYEDALEKSLVPLNAMMARQAEIDKSK